MSYPTPPGKRIPYDKNGTRVLMSRTAGDDRTPYQVHPTAVAALNSDLGHGVYVDRDFWSFSVPADTYYSKNYVSFLFPSPMDIQGVAIAAITTFVYTDFFSNSNFLYPNLTVELQVSTDTTNGLDDPLSLHVV